MKITPWKCHICGGDFENTEGGLCKICNKPTCLICSEINEVSQDSLPIPAENLICLTCTKSIEENGQVERSSVEVSRKLGATREKIREIERKAIAKLNKDKPPDDVA